jgi:holliday junction DNA helicase RuvA
MISRIEGKVVEHDGAMVVVDCSGVGYGVVVCPDEQGSLAVGSVATLYITENIKEDAYDLYGFKTVSRRGLYKQLTSVNGVGPKAAMAILAVDNENGVRRAIASGDTALLSRAQGVGKKVAERVVVDLKSKMGLIASGDATDFLQGDLIGDNDEAVQALTALGYSLADAKTALANIDKSLPTEARLKQVLRG